MTVTFHGNPELKRYYLKRIQRHLKMDNLIQGIGWENGKGCAVGCTLEKYDYAAYETDLGIPEWMARVEDRIFEALPYKEAVAWPEKFLRAIPVGVDLSTVFLPFVESLKEYAIKPLEKQGVDIRYITSMVDYFARGGHTNDASIEIDKTVNIIINAAEYADKCEIPQKIAMHLLRLLSRTKD
jgi:hypothetical protein